MTRTYPLPLSELGTISEIEELTKSTERYLEYLNATLQSLKIEDKEVAQWLDKLLRENLAHTGLRVLPAGLNVYEEPAEEGYILYAPDAPLINWDDVDELGEHSILPYLIETLNNLDKFINGLRQLSEFLKKMGGEEK